METITIYNVATGEITERELTPEEMAEFTEVENTEENLQEKYEKAVLLSIRQRYNSSQEFSIIRQKDEKPEEFEEYFNFCEQVKNEVKMQIFGSENI